MNDPYDCAVDLMRRLPPKDVEENFATLLNIIDRQSDQDEAQTQARKTLIDNLMSTIDQPLQTRRCTKTGQEYLICDYNRDGDSYRSPWSNEYEPEIPDGIKPSLDNRNLEIAANDAFKIYRELYFSEGVSSVYTFDIDDKFAVVVLIKKVERKSVWDSIHVVEIQERGRNAHYKLTSTVMLYLSISDKLNMNLSGSLTRQTEGDFPFGDVGKSEHTGRIPHYINIGRMIEDMERGMRSSLQEVYFGKTKDIVNDLRSQSSLKETDKRLNLQTEMTKAFLAGRAEK